MKDGSKRLQSCSANEKKKEVPIDIQCEEIDMNDHEMDSVSL